jgi:ATP-dependent Zn protease
MLKIHRLHYTHTLQIKKTPKNILQIHNKVPNKLYCYSSPIILAPVISAPIPEYILPSTTKHTIEILKAPPVLFNENDWNYTQFIYKIQNAAVDSVIITQDQKNATVHLKSGQDKRLILPDGYDIISFLLANNIPVNITPATKPAPVLSVLDITLIICQCVFLYFVIKTIMNRKTVNSTPLSTALSSSPTVDILTNANGLQQQLTQSPSTVADLIQTNGSMNDIPIDTSLQAAAYRESGQLISNLFINNLDMIDKVSIDKPSQITSPVATNQQENRQILEDKLKIILGGRVAEEIIFGALRSSSGKSSDIEIAVQLAYDIIATYGFSQSVGITEWDNFNTPYLQETIQKSVKRIIKRTYKEARKLIIKNKDLLSTIANELIAKKTLYKEDIRAIIIKTYKTTRKLNNKIRKHLNNSDIKIRYNSHGGNDYD